MDYGFYHLIKINKIWNLLYLTIFLVIFIDPLLSIYAIVFGIGLSMLLKSVIKDPRPNKINEYGMPSTHSQTYMLMCVYLYYKGFRIQSITVLLLWLITFYYKVECGDHSVEQYIIGGILGLVLGLLLEHLKIFGTNLNPFRIFLKL